MNDWHQRIGVEGDGMKSSITTDTQHRANVDASLMRHGLAFVLFLILSVIFFGIPVLSHMTTRYVGPTQDPTQFIMAMLWWPRALFHGTNPFIDRWIWMPGGQNLLWVTSMPLISLIMSPVTAIVGPVASYNIAMLLGPVLCAWAMYFLLSVLTKQWALQMWGGYVFGFSSYILGETLGHLILIWAFPLPLLVLIGIHVYRMQANSVIPPRRYRIWAVTLLIFLFGSTMEIFATFVFFSTLALIIAHLFAIKNPLLRHRVLSLSRWVLTTYILVALAISPLVAWMLAHPSYSGPPYSPAMFSANLLNYFIPTPLTWLGGMEFWRFSSTFTGNLTEQGAYLGLPLILLTLLAVIQNRSQFWIKTITATLAMVVVFSFGPVLHIGRHIVLPFLPWLLFTHIPLLQDALPTRFTLYVFFLVTVLTILGLEKLPRDRIYSQYLLLAGLVPLFLLPNLTWGKNIRWTPLRIPPLFSVKARYQKLIPRHSNVLMFPYGHYGNGIAIQAQTHFWFRLADGYWGPPPPAYNSWPLVQQLWSSPRIVVNPALNWQLAAMLKAQQVERVVAIKPDIQSASLLLRNIPGVRLIYSGSHTRVWAVSFPDTYRGNPSLSSVLTRSNLLQEKALRQGALSWLFQHGRLSVALLSHDA